MNIIPTLFKQNDSEFIPDKFGIDYTPIDVDLHKDGHTLLNIFLQWTPEQEVVTLPQRTFYINFGKRLIDIIISGLVLVFILSWLIPILGVLILIESKGPVLFVQTRSGRKGKPFHCLKIRTMLHVNETKKTFKQTDFDDKRVTAIGKFLRRTNIDEMPQFINVLLGHMSLVGPRPHAVPHDALHWSSPAYRERYWVRPGITGLAQIRGSRGATNLTQQMEHRIRYDHLYITRQTFLLDMKIIYKTISLTLKGDSNAW